MSGLCKYCGEKRYVGELYYGIFNMKCYLMKKCFNKFVDFNLVEIGNDFEKNIYRILLIIYRWDYNLICVFIFEDWVWES